MLIPPSIPFPTITPLITLQYSNTPKATQTMSPPPSTPSPIRIPTKIILPTGTEIVLGYAKISSEVEEVNLRKSPGYATKNDLVDVVITIPTGAIVKLLRGPKKADGLKWWYIEWHGYKGWIAERTKSGRIILVFNQ